MVEILENELRCVQRASTKRCDRECENCDLLMDTDDIVKAYGVAIKTLEAIPKIRGEIATMMHKEYENTYVCYEVQRTIRDIIAVMDKYLGEKE